MRAIWLSLAAASALLAGDSARAASRPTRRIVAFERSTTVDERRSIVASSGARVVAELPLIDALVVESRGDGADAARALSRRPHVLRVDADDTLRLASDGAAGAVAPVSTEMIPQGVRMVNAPAAWAVTRGRGVTVAVLDSGIDDSLPALRGSLQGSWNTFSHAARTSAAYFHGTFVAAIVAGRRGYPGVAPEAGLFDIQVVRDDGTSHVSTVIEGIALAVRSKADVINLSLMEEEDNPSLHAAIDKAIKAGVVVVAAAGNGGGPVAFPAAYPGVIAVAGCGLDGSLYEYSGGGKEIAFIAPGRGVTSLWPGGGVRALNGTSFAAPHVSGLAALAIAAGIKGPRDVRAALEAAATPLPGIAADRQGRGLIDAAKVVAVRAEPSGVVKVPVASPPPVPTTL